MAHLGYFQDHPVSDCGPECAASETSTSSRRLLAQMHDGIHRRGKTCLDAIAEGYITAQDLCPDCTVTFMSALDQAAGKQLAWHDMYHERATQGRN